MRAWKKEEMTAGDRARRGNSKVASEERKKLKQAAHAARQDLTRARKLHSAIQLGT